MIGIAVVFAAGCFGLGLLLCLWRVWRGPDPADRILALDTMVVNVIALLVLYGIAAGTGMIFETAILFAMTGFISSVAWAKFLLRGDIIE